MKKHIFSLFLMNNINYLNYLKFVTLKLSGITLDKMLEMFESTDLTAPEFMATVFRTYPKNQTVENNFIADLVRHGLGEVSRA